MIVVRAGAQRGHTQLGWLDSRHTFSFGEYRDPSHMGFRCLRVINDDRVIPGGGFATHSHRDMEIISYVMSGALSHRDSLGTTSVIRPGEVQRMSAGSGITHSEFNHSATEAVHFLQLWIVPDVLGIKPGYEQKVFARALRRNRFRVVADRAGTDGALTIHQDARLLVADLEAHQSIHHAFAPGRYGWLHVASGVVSIQADELRAGDGAAFSAESSLTLTSPVGAELLLFDLP